MIRMTLQALCALLYVVASVAQASPVNLDSSESDPIDFAHGTIVTAQYSGSHYGGVTIFADNDSQALDPAVTFDSWLSSSKTSDQEVSFPLNRDNEAGDGVPVPASFWLFGAALLGFIGLSRRTSV